MKLIKLFVIIPAVLLADVAAAQQTNVDMSGSVGLVYTRRAPSEAATGSQYFIENFMPARVDNSSEISTIRYNAYSDELEVKVNEEIKVLQPKENQIITLVNNKAAYQYVEYINKENIASQNYLVLVSNLPNLKIYKKEKVNLIPEVHPSGGYQKYKAPMYKKMDPEYYVKVKDGSIVLMPSKRKEIVSLFPGKEKEVEEFIKNNKISTDEDEDLARLGTYLNTIL